MRNPLNQVDGNIRLHLEEQNRENTASHEDRYKCDCGESVPEEEWICELKMCKECFEEHYGSSYISIDQAEYLKGDR